MSGATDSGRVALLTGSAGGLGRAMADQLQCDGWSVALSDLPGTGVAFPADLRDSAACAALVDDMVTGYGRLDLLVNNAATMYHGDLTLTDLDRWWDTIDINLSAPFRLARAACGPLRRTRGQIVNVASSFGFTGMAGFSAYCASKSGLVGLTKALALELAPDVRVNAIAPGHVDTRARSGLTEGGSSYGSGTTTRKKRTPRLPQRTAYSVPRGTNSTPPGPVVMSPSESSPAMTIMTSPVSCLCTGSV
jgi:NAD(P)-dependent dehydrogenase (short-subunit alcohol dehydrogenase family)